MINMEEQLTCETEVPADEIHAGMFVRVAVKEEITDDESSSKNENCVYIKEEVNEDDVSESAYNVPSGSSSEITKVKSEILINNEVKTEDGTEPFVCVVIKEEVNENDDLNELACNSPSDSSDPASVPPESIGDNKKRRIHSTSKRFSCFHCKFKVNTILELKKHILSHLDEEPLICDIYDYETIGKADFHKHMKLQAEKTFRCKLCPYESNQKKILNLHMRTHIGAKPYTCTVCDYSAAMRRDLTKHMQSHTSEKQLKCSMCDFCTIHKSALVNHVRSHIGKKLLLCEICDYRTVVKSTLMCHMRIHTGEKQHSCTLCSYKTHRKPDLNVHMLTHTGEKYKCTICNYSTSRRNNFTVHMRTHSGEKTRKCTMYDYSAIYKSTLHI